MKCSLAGAFARIDRADRHIDELKLLIERYRKAQEQKIVSDHETVRRLLAIPPGQKFTERRRSKRLLDFPLEAAVIVGEVIYNLRAALDYLAYELAWQDSGTEREKTQFLIETIDIDPKDPKRGFKARSQTCLPGFHQHHLDAMEDLQPYKGCAWTKTLRDISNPDKHRHLTVIDGSMESTSRIEEGISGSFDDRPGQILRGVGGSTTDTHIDLQHSLKVTLADGTDIVKTLEILKREVRATLDAFQPEFK